MRGVSFRTKASHQEIWMRYCEKLKEYGHLATSIQRSKIYKDISDETEYHETTIKRIVNHMTKKRDNANR